MKSFRFGSFTCSALIVFLFIGFLAFADTVSAQSCGKGALAGTCKDSCNGATEVEIGVILGNYQQYYNGVDIGQLCSGKSCCVPKGAGLCSHLAGIDTDVPIGLVGKYKCEKACQSDDLTKYASGVEACTGGQVCCAVPAVVPTSTKPAPTGGGSSPVTLDNPLGNVTIYDIIQKVIQAFLGMVGAIALAVFVYAGILWMTAGDSKRVQTAKDAMKYAVLGIAMIAFAYAITNFVLNAFTGSLVK